MTTPAPAKNTVAAVRAETVEQFEQVMAKLAEKKKEIAGLKAACEAKDELIGMLGKRITDFERRTEEDKDDSEMIEVVAAPFEGVAAPGQLVYGGVKYDAIIKKGFAHFKVPRKYAEILLTDTSCGWPYRLTGREEPITIRRRVGQRTEDVTVQPYVLGETSKGTPYLLPVKDDG